MNVPAPEDAETFRIDAPSSGTLHWPKEDYFPMRHAEWKRIRERVKTLSNPLPYLGQIGWACMGIGASALLAYLPWAPAYSALPARAQLHYAAVSPALIIIGIAAIVIAIFCMVVSRVVRAHERASAASVLTEMDSIYEPHDPDRRSAAPVSTTGS